MWIIFVVSVVTSDRRPLFSMFNVIFLIKQTRHAPWDGCVVLLVVLSGHARSSGFGHMTSDVWHLFIFH